MQYTVPHYYKKFTCLSGDCPDTCCAGWQIQIDPVSLKKYRKTEGPLGARLHNEIDWEESCFRQYNGRCAFLNEENLCDLYTEGGGEKAFCRTCRTYPRHIEEFEGLREISLSLSCPAAARLILECQEPVRFLHKKNDKEENEPDFDYLLFTKLTDARALIFHILQDRSRPVELRLAVSLNTRSSVQVCIHRDALFDCDDLFDRYRSPGVWDWFQRRLNGKETFVASLRMRPLRICLRSWIIWRSCAPALPSSGRKQKKPYSSITLTARPAPAVMPALIRTMQTRLSGRPLQISSPNN